MIQSLKSSSLVDSPAILQLVRYFAISHVCFRNSNAFLSLDTFGRSAGLSSSIIKSGSCESPDRTPCAKFDTGYSLKSHLFKNTKKNQYQNREILTKGLLIQHCLALPCYNCRRQNMRLVGVTRCTCIFSKVVTKAESSFYS